MTELSAGELMVQATKGLKLRDIILFAARLERAEPEPESDLALPAGVIEASGPQAIQIEVVQQQKQVVKAARGGILEEGRKVDLLQVRVELGIRVVRSKDGQPTESLVFLVEADFVVEYEVVSELQEEAIRAFAQFHAVHNVWPFWRQHVFDVVQRARLPSLDVPLFEGRAI
jgi:hypothetical protein